MSDKKQLFDPEQIQKAISDFNTKYADVEIKQKRIDEISALVENLESEFTELLNERLQMKKDMEIEARQIFGMIVDYMKMPQYTPDAGNYGGLYSQTLSILREMKKEKI